MIVRGALTNEKFVKNYGIRSLILQHGPSAFDAFQIVGLSSASVWSGSIARNSPCPMLTAFLRTLNAAERAH